MDVIVYHNAYDANDSLEQFLDVLFYQEMHYLASDLLDKGLSPDDINQAINRAMLAAKTAGVELRQHFIPIYTDIKGSLVKDCKMSKLGYGLLLLNANTANPMVANWQRQLLEHFFDEQRPTAIFKGHPIFS